MDAEAARGVRGGLNHTSLVPPAADYQELDVAKLRMIVPAHFDEEGVEVHMENSGGHR